MTVIRTFAPEQKYSSNNQQSEPSNHLSFTPLNRRTKLAMALSLAIIAQQSYAQETTSDETSTANGIEIINVTAQKRSENLQEVPIAITAFSEDAIRKIGASDLNDLGLYSAGFESNNATATQTTWTVRGISTNDFGIGLDPAVAVYIDGVYIGRRGTSNLNFNDIERVEILKGPQGTLFGRNSAAGAVNIITKAPIDDFEGNVRFTLGNYYKRKFEGLINVPINDHWSMRASYTVNNRDGYLDAIGRDDLGTEHDWGIRTSFFGQYDDLDIVLRADVSKLNQDSRPAATLNVGYGLGDPFGPVETDAGDDVYEARDVKGISAELNWDLGNNMTFTSITAYREFTRYNGMEDDGSAFDRAFFVSVLDEDQNQFSQEFRLTGASERLKWTVGATYFQEDIAQDTHARFKFQTFDGFALTNAGVDPSTIADITPGLGMAGLFLSRIPAATLAEIAAGSIFTPNDVLGLIVAANYDRPYAETTSNKNDIESWAAYADATYSVTDKLDFTFGLRYTRDEKTFDIFTEYQNEIIIPFAGYDNIPVGIAFAVPTDVQQNASWSKLTPRFVVDYQWTKDIMTYASYSEGFKAGGFNTLGEAPPVDEETVENIEIGFKSSWYDNRLRVNTALFSYDYTDLQNHELDGPAGTVPTYNLRNVDAEGQGVEVEVKWQATDELLISVNYGYLDTEYTKWGYFPWEEEEIAQGIAVPDLTGEPISGMPANRYSIAFDYTTTFDHGDLAVHFDYAHSGERQDGIDGPQLPILPYNPDDVEGLTPDNKIAAYNIANFRLTYFPNEYDVSISLYARNLFDEKYILGTGGQAMSVGSPIANPGLPRMYGIEVDYTF